VKQLNLPALTYLRYGGQQVKKLLNQQICLGFAYNMGNLKCLLSTKAELEAPTFGKH
jgi:hypothetical protein